MIRSRSLDPVLYVQLAVRLLKVRSLRKKLGWRSKRRVFVIYGVRWVRFFRSRTGFDLMSYLERMDVTFVTNFWLRKVDWLKKKRFGSEELNRAAVCKLSQLELTRLQLEIISRGPRFGISLQRMWLRRKFLVSLSFTSVALGR